MAPPGEWRRQTAGNFFRLHFTLSKSESGGEIITSDERRTLLPSLLHGCRPSVGRSVPERDNIVRGITRSLRPSRNYDRPRRTAGWSTYIRRRARLNDMYGSTELGSFSHWVGPFNGAIAVPSVTRCRCRCRRCRGHRCARATAATPGE